MKTKLFLIVIILIASLLRLWNLKANPPHLTQDEAALGYNAYSILKTGKDEHGEVLPIVFKSFGDYKPGLYVYLAVPFVAAFGLTETAVRLPSALSGVVAVYLLYMIVYELFQKKKIYVGNKTLGLVAALVLATNPWHIHLSRGAWEVNVALTLTLIGIYFFICGFKNARYFYAAALFFSSTLLTYQGAKLSTALVVVSLLIGYWNEISKLVKNKSTIFIGPVLLGLLVSVPIILSLFQGKTGRLDVYSVFSYPRKTEDVQSFLEQSATKKGSLEYYLFYSEPLYFTRVILEHWFNHYSGRFLLFDGDWQNPRNTVVNHGVLLMADGFFLLIGTGALLKNSTRKQKIFIFAWLFLSPLPAAFSRDQIQALRAFNEVVPLVIITAVGIVAFARSKFTKFIAFAIYIGSMVYLLDAYFVHNPVHNGRYYQYGYKEVVQKISPIQKNYNKIVVQQSYDQPYIFFLFYQKYDPQKYQSQNNYAANEVGDVGLVSRLDNIEFKDIYWPHDRGEKGTLFAGNEEKLPDQDIHGDDFNVLDTVNLPTGENVFKLVEVKS